MFLVCADDCCWTQLYPTLSWTLIDAPDPIKTQCLPLPIFNESGFNLVMVLGSFYGTSTEIFSRVHIGLSLGVLFQNLDLTIMSAVLLPLQIDWIFFSILYRSYLRCIINKISKAALRFCVLFSSEINLSVFPFGLHWILCQMNWFQTRI